MITLSPPPESELKSPEVDVPGKAPMPPPAKGALGWFSINAGLFFLMLFCVGAAWLAQAYFFNKEFMRGIPPPLAEQAPPPHILLGKPGLEWIGKLTPKGAMALYFGAIAAFGALAAFVQRRALASAAYDPLLAVGEAPPPEKKPTPIGLGILYAAGFLVCAAAFVFLALFAQASARADRFVFGIPDLKFYESILKRFYAALGYTQRPNAFWPFYAWVGTALTGAAAVGFASRLFGLPWGETATGVRARHPSRRRWEWLALGAWVIIATACYLWRSDKFPYNFHQSEGLIGLGAKVLLDDSLRASVFDNSIQPFTCFVHRAPAVAFAGPTLAAQRLTTALASGVGLMIIFLALRSFVTFLPAFLTTIMFSFLAVTLHYSRTGLDNIEAMYWIALTLWVFYSAETSAPGISRNVKYFAVGWLMGGSFGQFTGAPLVAVIIALMMGLRFCFQMRDRGRLILTLALLALGFAAAFVPFYLNPKPVFTRQRDITIFRADVFPGLFKVPDPLAPPNPSFFVLLAFRGVRAALGFFTAKDTVGECGMHIPFSGVLLSSLALLGSVALVFRFRSWHTIWIVIMFGLGCLLGGAVLWGPDPPSSARLQMLFPALLASAATALQLLLHPFLSALARLREWSGGRRRAVIAWLAAGGLLTTWVFGADLYANVTMYTQIYRDPRMSFISEMRATTEIYRALEKYNIRAVKNYQYATISSVDQGYVYNRYLNENLVFVSPFVPTGTYPAPNEVPPGLVMFIFERVEPWATDMKEIMNRFPGGKLFQTDPIKAVGMDWNYYIYLYENRPALRQAAAVPEAAAPAPETAAPPDSAPAMSGEVATTPTLAVGADAAATTATLTDEAAPANP